MSMSAVRMWWLVVLCVGTHSGAVAGRAQSPAEAHAVAVAAARGWPEMRARIPAGMWRDYGFADGGAMASATLGEPLPMLAITPAALAAYQPGDSVEALLSATTLWYVPLAADGAIRSMLVVDRVAGEWQAVSLGYAPLAKALERMFAQWPATKGYHPRLVMVVQAQQYLYTVPELGPDNLTPLQGAAAKARPAGVDRVADAVAVLKPAVARNVAGQPGGAP